MPSSSIPIDDRFAVNKSAPLGVAPVFPAFTPSAFRQSPVGGLPGQPQSDLPSQTRPGRDASASQQFTPAAKELQAPGSGGTFEVPPIGPPFQPPASLFLIPSPVARRPQLYDPRS